MTGFTNTSQNNEQILSDIQSLQQTEKDLFTNLETNTNLTPEQQQQLIEKINQISNMRINLYKTLSDINEFYENSLTSSVGTLKEQTLAIGIVESELNKAKKRLEILENEKNNKIRLVEINNYYGDKYAEHSELMKIIILTFVPIIIIFILHSKNLLPDIVYKILLIVISIIGSIFFLNRYFSIVMRDNMNYQAYNWNFDANISQSESSTTSGSDPWASTSQSSSFGTCTGQSCCSSGQVYDSSLNVCVIITPTSATTTSATTTSATTTSTTTESFDVINSINNILIKKQPNKYKEDYNMRENFDGHASKNLIH